MKKIKVTVKNGVPTIVTEGFEGETCLDATKNLELLLSGNDGVEVRDIHGEIVVEQLAYASN